jgi:hypothetical protein
MTLPEFIDRKRQLEVEIAYAAERYIAEFERETDTRIERVVVTPINRALSSAVVEVRL